MSSLHSFSGRKGCVFADDDAEAGARQLDDADSSSAVAVRGGQQKKKRKAAR